MVMHAGCPGHWQVSELLFLLPQSAVLAKIQFPSVSHNQNKYEAFSSILVEQDMNTGLWGGA